MYVVSLDLGCTNFKAIVLEIEDNKKEANISIVGKVRETTTDFAKFVLRIYEKFDLTKDKIEAFIVTGTGSEKIGSVYDGVKVVKIDEFDAITYGGLILSDLEEAIIVSIGTGTTIMHSSFSISQRVGGTGLGGGTFIGLSSAIINNDKILNFNELIELAKKGDNRNVDLVIGDISEKGIADMSLDITAANFAGVYKKSKVEDKIYGVLNLILENICLLIRSLSKDLPIVFIGTLVSDEFVMNRLNTISKYTGGDFRFVKDPEYAISVGAWEYYLLNLRKNI